MISPSNKLHVNTHTEAPAQLRSFACKTLANSPLAEQLHGHIQSPVPQYPSQTPAALRGSRLWAAACEPVPSVWQGTSGKCLLLSVFSFPHLLNGNGMLDVGRFNKIQKCQAQLPAPQQHAPHRLPAGAPDTRTHPMQASAGHTDTPNAGQRRTHGHTQPRPAPGAGVSREWRQHQVWVCAGSGPSAGHRSVQGVEPGPVSPGELCVHPRAQTVLSAQPGLAEGVCLQQSHLGNQSVQVTGR